jgi:hypothetical protein
MDEATRKQIISIIDDVGDMTIATVRKDGYPQATTVSFVNDGLTIYFGTSASSQKARNIARNSKVIAGIAMRVSDPAEEQKIGSLLIEKFPQIPDFVPPGEADIALFRIEPKIISLLDYSKGFGHTELFEV